MSYPARGAVIEIIQKQPATDTMGGSIIVPEDIRINGQSVVGPADQPVVIERIEVNGNEVVSVTMTLWPRRVIIGTAEDVNDPSP